MIPHCRKTRVSLFQLGRMSCTPLLFAPLHRFDEVALGRLQRSGRALCFRTVYHGCHGLECAEEHFYAPVTVREQAGRVSKVLRLCSNLDRHVLSVLAALIDAVTKVSVIKVLICGGFAV
jgi:hypothetical protein